MYKYIKEMEATTFTILAEPTRLRIVQALKKEGLPVGEIVEKLDSTQPTISKHLKILRDAGFVNFTVDAQRRIYQLEAAPFKDLDLWLEPYRQLWNRNLDALEGFLDGQLNQAESKSNSENETKSE